jgi:flagellar motor switch protein FliG
LRPLTSAKRAGILSLIGDERMAVGKLTGPKKAAILLLALGEEVAAVMQIWKKLKSNRLATSRLASMTFPQNNSIKYLKNSTVNL